MRNTKLETYWKRRLSPALLFIFLVAFSSLALAEKAGWETDGTKVWYNTAMEDGNLERAKGLTKIGSRTFYFNESGELQTGFVKTEEGIRYFYEKGELGLLGKMIRKKIKKVKGTSYGFSENGVVYSGLTELDGSTYFFDPSPDPGVAGRMLVSEWASLEDGRSIYLGADGKMIVNAWVENDSYYVGENGGKLVDTVTPDGYLVDVNGARVRKMEAGFVQLGGEWHFYSKKKQMLFANRFFTYKGSRYYVDENGVRAVGWKEVDGSRYFFNEDGVMQTGIIVLEGVTYEFADDGKLVGEVTMSSGNKEKTGKASVLILCGHGQGDSGAVSSWGQEQNYTRQFGNLIYKHIKAQGVINIDIFNVNYDMYQQNRNTLNAVKVNGKSLQSQVTGKGTLKSHTYQALKGNSLLPDFLNYDYILEIHLNAKSSGKDVKGDGKFSGACSYVNVYKTDTSIDREIIAAMVAVGFKQFGNGVYQSDGLLNARVFTELGINYSLLETCFIDDGDDMKFYNEKRVELAQAVANAIMAHFV